MWGEVLFYFLEELGIYVLIGLVCLLKERVKIGGSYVLKCLGLLVDEILGGIRFFFFDDNKIEEVDYVI